MGHSPLTFKLTVALFTGLSVFTHLGSGTSRKGSMGDGDVSRYLSELSLMTIRLGAEQAQTKYDAFQRWADSATDPSRLKAFTSCAGDYNLVLLKLGHAYKLSQKEEYESITDRLEEALLLVSVCRSRLRVEGDSPSTDLGEYMMVSLQAAISVNKYILGCQGN